MKLNTQSLADVTLGTPLLTPGSYWCVIAKAEVKENSKKSGNNLNVEVRILDASVLERDTGKEIPNKGQSFKLFRTISLVPTDKYNPDAALKELAVAIGLPEDLAELDSNDLLNKTCKCIVKVKPADGQYAEGNDIAGWRKPGPNEVVPDVLPF